MNEICLKNESPNADLKLLHETTNLTSTNISLRWRLFNLYQKQRLIERSP
ncbi:MAG: hypothetical protein LBV77_04830 [Candidatus Adiutrix intracellularis]|nr:hypothetical protein [Candidatus Adiutrix intracellularis]